MAVMTERTHRQPDVARPAVGLAVDIGLRPPSGLITVRVALRAEGTGAAVHQATGLALPGRRQRSAAGDRAALWMAPDELLICVAAEECPAIIEKLEAALAGTPHLVVDMSDAWSVFRLTGNGAREVLAKGAPVDLHGAAFRPGMVRRTHFSRVDAIICQVGEHPDAFDLFCFRSYARYVSECLARFATPGSLPGILDPQ